MAEESAAAAVSSDQLAEYENQLNEINELLKATPDDASLLSVKADLEELLALTRGGAATEEATQPPSIPPPPATLPPPEPVSLSKRTSDVASVEEVGETKAASAGDEKEVPVKKKRKKLKAVKDFEVPAHLIPLESDSNAEKKRKKRAIKMLKNQWRERKKEVESTNKQQSWQSFNNKKKRKTTESSIFRTQDGVNTKVGVISAGSMTEFNERKRHQRT